MLGQFLLQKPTRLLLLANDVCNASCTMCHIWQHQPQMEISLAILRQTLANSAYYQIRRVEISGGEPTLRPDLVKVGDVLVAALPKLERVQLLTNALESQTAIQRILALAQIIQDACVKFEVSVSLDGVGREHDRVRGVEGNFAAAVSAIGVLKELGVHVSLSCTLTPLNVHGADDLLLWSQDNGLPLPDFRLALDIERYDNS